MMKWANTDQAIFNTLVKMSQKTLMRSMYTYLKKYYNEKNIFLTEDFILCEGEAPIMLVAHMDTVFKVPPSQIYYDQKQGVMWSPQGLGADDRAGVFLIWKIVQSGLRPHICLTTNEEVGGLGAAQLVKTCPKSIFPCKYIVELDRQGTNDCVFYSCANQQFQEFVEGYGFITSWGTYSDISAICPAWHIAGVNLSVGYQNEHREIETLNIRAMMDTYKKVFKMIKEINAAPSFEYIPDPYERYYYSLGRKYASTFDDWAYAQQIQGKYPISTHKVQCCKCNKIYSEDDVFPVKSRTFSGETKYYCIDCVDTDIAWCRECGEAFEMDTDEDELCPDCAGKIRCQPIAKEG